jgi:cell shape-determining protein MreC
MKLDLKTGIALATLLFTISGFYYTTNSRLKEAEFEILRLQKQVGVLERGNKRLNKKLNEHVAKESHNK